MPTTTTVSPTGNLYVDGILSGAKWGTASLTYSFPSGSSYYGSGYGGGEATNNFKAFTQVQQDAVKLVLASYSAVANISFTEVVETTTTHGDLRYAESDAPSTAWAYYPSVSAAGGDAWFNNSKHYYDIPIVGNYAYSALLHETGHALGLKHPQDIKGSFGAEPLDHDSLEYTVMSYRSYIGGSATSGYTNEAYSFPQTLMMLDIAAIQEMYGANFTTQSADSVYKWSPTTGEMFINGVGQSAPGGDKIFMTIWDGGGNDTYDFSNYATDLTVNLSPGGWTTVSSPQLAYLGSGHYAAGNIANALLFDGNTASLIENATGGSGSDSLIGNVADNRLTGGAGNDSIDGSDGKDTAIYVGNAANYIQVHNADGTWSITDLFGLEGTDTLTNIEVLQFADSVLQLGTISPVPLVPTSPVVANSAPMITSTPQAASLTEWKDHSTNETANTAHVARGAFTYVDADATDPHSASFVAQGVGYLGTLSLDVGNIDSSHTIDWSFSVPDNAIDYLKAGQTLTQSYKISIDDGHGGITSDDVTITLIGAGDAVARFAKGALKKSGAAEMDVQHPNAADFTVLSDKIDVSGDQAAAPAGDTTTEVLMVLGVSDIELDWYGHSWQAGYA
jgi:VCBS repeat-containing protein